jgi:hypothetical protein
VAYFPWSFAWCSPHGFLSDYLMYRPGRHSPIQLHWCSVILLHALNAFGYRICCGCCWANNFTQYFFDDRVLCQGLQCVTEDESSSRKISLISVHFNFNLSFIKLWSLQFPVAVFSQIRTTFGTFQNGCQSLLFKWQTADQINWNWKRLFINVVDLGV